MRTIILCVVVLLVLFGPLGGPAGAEGEDARIDRLLETLGQPTLAALDALQELRTIGAPVIPKARALLAAPDTSPTLRWRAAQLLGFVEAQEAVEDLLKYVNDEAGRPLGPVAAVALRQIGGPTAIDGLRRALEAASDPGLRSVIEDCLRVLEGAEETKPLPPPAPAPRQALPPGPSSPPWVFFHSRETSAGPRLEIVARDGTVHVVPCAADTVLIEYIGEGHFGAHQRLSVDEADWNRVLLLFEVPDDLATETAHLVVELARGAVRVDDPIRASLHRLTEAWTEADATWKNAPAFEEEAALAFDLPPREGTVRIDVTSLFAPERKTGAHGWLVHVAEPGAYQPAAPAPTVPQVPAVGAGAATTPTTRRLLSRFDWAPDAATARARAREEGKLVFALLRATHDSAASTALEEIYLACVLADPTVATLVEESFVPVRLAVRGWAYPLGQASRPDALAPLGASVADTKPLALVVATAEGSVVGRLEGMGTFAPEITTRVLVDALEAASLPPTSSDPQALFAAGRWAEAGRLAAGLDARTATYLQARMALRRGDLQAATALARTLRDAPADAPYRNEAAALLELAFLRGATVDAATRDAMAAMHTAFADEIRYRRGVVALRGAWYEEAAPHWSAIGKSSPWQLKLAAWTAWPGRMYVFERPTAPAALGRSGTTEQTFPDVDLARAAGIQALLDLQRPDGSWPNATRETKTLAAITALAARALFASCSAVGDERAASLEEGLARAHAWLETYLDDADPETANSFGQAYLLDYALDRLAADPGLRRFAQKAVAFCAGGQMATGAWSYDKRWGETWRGGFGGWPVTEKGRAHSMNTGPCLVALARAKAMDLRVDDAVLTKGQEALLAMRDAPGVFTYTWPEPRNFNQADTSIGRAPVCEHALFLLGATPVEDVATALKVFMEHRDDLRRVAKVTSGWVPPRGVSSYFQMYAWHHAMRAARVLETEEAAAWRAVLIRDMLSMAEVDGTWLDFEDMGKAYGTAMALLVLAEVE